MQKILIIILAVLVPGFLNAEPLEDLLISKGLIAKSEIEPDPTEAQGYTYFATNNYSTLGNSLSGMIVDYPSQNTTFNFNAFLQERYEFIDYNSSTDKSNRSSFSTEAARLQMAGTILYDEFRYKLEAEFASEGDQGTNRSELLDAYLTWHPCNCSGLKLGQFKPSVSRQYSAYDANLQFTDRSRVGDYFIDEREQGVRGYYRFFDDTLEAGASIFNGDSTGEGQNRPGVDTRQTWVVDLRYNPLGKIDPFSEGDTDWSEDAGISIGTSYAYLDSNQNENDITASQIGRDINLVSADLNLKYQGFSLQSELLYQTESYQNEASLNGDDLGYYVQSGYFITPKKLEIAARYAHLDCDSSADQGLCEGNDSVSETTVGVNYFFLKHRLKAQLNYSRLSENPINGVDSDQEINSWIFQVSAML